MSNSVPSGAPIKPRKPDPLLRGVSVPQAMLATAAPPPKPPKSPRSLRSSRPSTSKPSGGSEIHPPPPMPAIAAAGLEVGIRPPMTKGVSSSASNVSSLGRSMTMPASSGLDRVQSVAMLRTPATSSGSSEKVLLDGIGTIRDLIRRRSWRLVQKTAERYRKESEGFPHFHFQFRLAHIIALMKFRLYRNAQEDIDALGDLDDPRYSYESHPLLYPGTTGSFVPFSLRVIKAELPSFLNLAFHSIDLLFALVEKCRKEITARETAAREASTGPCSPARLDPFEVHNPLLSTDPSSLWYPQPFNLTDTPQATNYMLLPDDRVSLLEWRLRVNRLLFSIVTRFCIDREYPSALEVLQHQVAPIYQRDPSLLSAIGRINLQMGNVAVAVRAFQQAEEECARYLLVGQPYEIMKATNRALIAFAQNDFEVSIEEFSRVLELDPDNYHATNNLAICYLYAKKLVRAITSFETAIRSNPQRNLVEPLVLNLCALYDLESENSTAQKREMWKLVSKHADDSFDYSVLKLKIS